MLLPKLIDHSGEPATTVPFEAPAAAEFNERSRHRDDRGVESLQHIWPRDLGDWRALLADLALLGRVWVETHQRGVRVAFRHRLCGLRIQGSLGYLDTRGQQIRILLERCSALNAIDEAPGQGLVIWDRDARPLVSIRSEAGAHPWPLRLLLATWGAGGHRSKPASAGPDAAPMARIEQHAVGRLQRDARALERAGRDPDGEPGGQLALGFRDLAELSGHVSWRPWPRARATTDNVDRAIAIDPSLVPCALETLVDQVHPLVLTTGSHGWVSRSIQSFYAHADVDGQLRLRGDEARLELDRQAIASAWVVGEHTPGVDRRSLRLYDPDGRAMAVIASAVHPGADRALTDTGKAGAAGTAPPRHLRRREAQLWTTLMNALTS